MRRAAGVSVVSHGAEILVLGERASFASCESDCLWVSRPRAFKLKVLQADV